MKILPRTCTIIDDGVVIPRQLDKYGYFFDDNGVRQFGVVGEEDSYAPILRHKDDTDYSILKRYLFDNPGQIDKGIYGVRLPIVSDVNDMRDMVNDLNDMYNALPPEIKQKYKNFSEVINEFTQEDLQMLKSNLDNNKPSDEVSKDE